MILDLIAQSVPSLGAAIAALFIVALLLAASLDPELVEVYLGDSQLLVATLALALIVVVFAASAPTNAAHLQEFPLSRSIAAASP